MPRIVSTQVVIPQSLSPEERSQFTDALYAVHQQIFEGVEREAFAKYVVESKAEHTWIQVHKNEAGNIVGYFALHVFERQFKGKPTAVFRAEAGSLRAYRGGSVNMRFGLMLVLRYLVKHPGQKAYYLGSLIHPSSYSMLASHCGTVWPQRGQETPLELVAFMDELANEFGLEKVDPAQPLVRQVNWRTRETEVEREYWRHCDKPAGQWPGVWRDRHARGRAPLRVRSHRDGLHAGAHPTSGGAAVDGGPRPPATGRVEYVRRTAFRGPDARVLALRPPGPEGPAGVAPAGRAPRAGHGAGPRCGGGHVRVRAHGGVEFEQVGVWMATRGAMLVEAAHPLQVVAREPARVILLPRAAAARTPLAMGHAA